MSPWDYSQALSEVEGSKGLGNGNCLQTDGRFFGFAQNDRQEGVGITIALRKPHEVLKTGPRLTA